jgi:DNA-binding CsgD family transcriptional regulator
MHATQGKPVLTELEIKIIRLVCEEVTSKGIAKKLSTRKKAYPLRTIEGYRRGIQQKIGVRSAVGLARYAIREGIFIDTVN